MKKMSIAFEHRTSIEKCCLTKENQSLAHTVTPHNLSPVLGATNPLDQSTEIADFRTLIQATFQANTKPTAILFYP